ncbi:MAG TPA: hypothetical protein VHM19_14475, partial [Polyangiales bacterium]|nr:hypothetical protein [Polyangiales bacterium]
MRAEGLALGNAVCCLAGCLALAAACTGHGTDDRAAWWMAQRAGDAATPPAHVTSQAGARAAASEQDAAAGIAAADGGGDAALDAGDTGRSGWLGDAQRSGSAGRGRDLLLNNGTPEAPYLSCGIPDKLWQLGTLGGLADSTKNEPRIADRQQGNAELPYYLSYARVASGVRVITTNCLLCHASKLGGSLVMGLGDPNRDFAQKGSVFGIPIAALQVAGVVLSAAERVELDRFRNRLEAVNAYTTTDTVGMNPADTLFGVLAAHRDPVTLTWHDTADPNATLTPEVRLTSDVPAWWNLHRRDRMFWNGFGRGDHARIMMSAALLCMK